MDMESIIAALLPYSTCDVSNALSKLNHPGSGFVPDISMWSPQRQAGDTRIIGPAHTVKYVLNSETDKPVMQGPLVDAVPRGSVLFLSMPKGVLHAAYGGLMTQRVRFRGVCGTVIDGNFRDLEEQRRLEYPVFARGVSTHAYYEVARPSEVNVPLLLQDGQTTIEPGDLVVADLNGVVCVPKALLTKVVDLVPQLSEAEAHMAQELENGASFEAASQKHRGKRS